MSHGIPAILHLMLADDQILFCRVSAVLVGELRNCLHLYKQWSGQHMSKEKSSIFGARNASKEQFEDLGTIIGVGRPPHVLNYLGHKL